MDFLNNAISQLRDLFKGMTPGSRMTAGMLLALIVVSLFYLFAYQGRTADRYLFGSREFSDKDIATMQRAFSVENLDRYMLDGKRIRVPGGELNSYMKALDKAEFLPADIEADITAIRERGSSFLESEKEKEFWRGQAQQQKLARAIAKRPEIGGATVQYREVKTRGFPPVVERKATVVVWGANNQPIDRATAKTIRSTASFWFGIRPEDVAVNDVNGITYSDMDDADGLSKEARMYAVAKANYETEFRIKIQNALSVFPGVVATVNAVLDPSIFNESTKVIVDPQATAVQSSSFSKNRDSRPAAGGRPGAETNQVRSNEPRTLASLNTQQTTSDETGEQQVSVTGHEVTTERTAALRPKVVTATVSIPKSYFKAVWHERNPTAEGATPTTPQQSDLDKIEAEIIKQIQDKVVTVLPPLEAGANPFPQVEVSSYDDLPAEPIEPPSMATTTMAWFSTNWRTLGLFALGLISLFVLRGMIRSVTPATASAAAQTMPTDAQATDEEESEHEDEETPAVLHRRAPATGVSLRDELTNMVREDPDAAANVLRTWIGDAA